MVAMKALSYQPNRPHLCTDSPHNKHYATQKFTYHQLSWALMLDSLHELLPPCLKSSAMTTSFEPFRNSTYIAPYLYLRQQLSVLKMSLYQKHLGWYLAHHLRQHWLEIQLLHLTLSIQLSCLIYLVLAPLNNVLASEHVQPTCSNTYILKLSSWSTSARVSNYQMWGIAPS